ncbi:glucose-1-phosphate adenylyltransferase family protein [Deinococcus yavapaiensis]|uniref:Glucose-1-phosphate adenylyltransferase n=1 Tax=Deinococcus yavapaiensis KR-236 TaxID=694435 RepID=A0A318SSC6_9DEIO|nr:sugar phosphate nucleotidyltransferase [Deinococcus yavapaiensis]PYE55917.1 glucose-1-phosphate adenylyltransferase [Deinococcus yavapaiensis KR-236]
MTTRVRGRRVLTLILAGGKGSRLGSLTKYRAKPVLPFGGTYRLIDFALSNCVHSGLSDVWVLEQYELHTLNAHLANGRPWDLDRTRGGVQVLPPFTSDGSDDARLASGNAHALHVNAPLLREYRPDVVVVLSADHVYRLDLADVISHHLDKNASVTMVTTSVPEGETAHRFGNVVLDDERRVTEFAYKPDEPISDVVTTEVFVYDAPHLFETLDRLAAAGELTDFGHELVPALVSEGRAFAYPFEGYWRDVGTLDAYWEAHQQLLAGKLPPLDDPAWPTLTYHAPRSAARLEKGAVVEDSLVSLGCRVAGRVERSVLSPGVVVEAGAVVTDSVLLNDVTVRANAKVERAVVDEGATIDPNASVGTPHEVTLVPAHTHVEAGEQLEGDDLPTEQAPRRLNLR